MYSRLCFHGARPGLVMGGSSELFQCIRARHNLHFILLTKNSQPSFWLCLAKAHQAPLCTADKFPAMWRQDRVSQHQWGTSAGPRETLSLCVFAIMWAEYLGWKWGRGPTEAEGRVGGGLRGRERERRREWMFRLLSGVLSFLKCMCYHSNVVFTTAGGEHRVTEKRRGNARHSKMSKIHTLGLSVFTTHKLSWGGGGGGVGETHFNINGWQAGSVCLRFLLASWKYPAEAMGRVFAGKSGCQC